MNLTPATSAEIIVRTHSGLVSPRKEKAVTLPDEIGHGTPFTGEYVVPGKTPDNEWLPHIERYRFASHVAPGKVILDVACGTGYGSDLLAGLAAKRVVGGDASPEALSFAAHTFRRENLSFLKLDGIRLPFRSSTFDAVVSFETVEHMKDPARFLRECARVLRPNGILLCSTPMRLAWRPPWMPKPQNPFHTREFTVNELRAALDERFDQVEFFGQACIGTLEWVTRYVVSTSDFVLSRIPTVRARSQHKLDWLLGYWPPASRRAQPLDPRRFEVRPLSPRIPGFPGAIVAKAVRRA